MQPLTAPPDSFGYEENELLHQYKILSNLVINNILDYSSKILILNSSHW